MILMAEFGYMHNIPQLLNDPVFLTSKISHVLNKNYSDHPYSAEADNIAVPSSVLLLLGNRLHENGFEPCLILNKRSRKVRQPGDLCCPGGSLSPIDPFLAKLMPLPGSPVTRWSYWFRWKNTHPEEAKKLMLFLTAGLREGFEEMRLNPLGVRFLGPLPPERLRIFKRIIYPLAVWVGGQTHFIINREVEKIVYIPLRALLKPANYVRYRVHYTPRIKKNLNRESDDFHCFIYRNQEERELLWGVTFRIVAAFMETIFGFVPPSLDSLRVVSRTLQESYLTGK